MNKRYIRRLLRKYGVKSLIFISLILAVLVFMNWFFEDIQQYRLTESDKNVDTSLVCYVDDESYYDSISKYIPESEVIPLMSLDKQSDFSDPELIDEEEVLAIYHGFPWAEPNPLQDTQNLSGYGANPTANWIRRGLTFNPWTYGIGGISKFKKGAVITGIDSQGNQCNVVIGKVPEPNTLLMILLGFGSLLFIRRLNNVRSVNK